MPLKVRMDKDEIFPWSPWIPMASALIALVAIAVAVHQRQMMGGSMVRPLVYATIAMLPFLLDFFDLFVPFRLALPLELFPIPVLVGGGLLVADPATVDSTPFIFVFLAAEVASRAGKNMLISLGTVLAANGLMVGVEVFGPYEQSFFWVIGISF